MECEFEHPENNWYRVPKWVEDYPIEVLDVYAFRILCHLARRDKGARSDASELCERFGIAYDGTIWRRCSKQLRELQALEEVTVRCAGGRLRTVLRFRWPPKPEPAGRGKTTAGEVVTGRGKTTDSPVEKQRAPFETKTGAARRRIRGEAAHRAGDGGSGEILLETASPVSSSVESEPAGKTLPRPEDQSEAAVPAEAREGAENEQASASFGFKDRWLSPRKSPAERARSQASLDAATGGLLSEFLREPGRRRPVDGRDRRW